MTILRGIETDPALRNEALPEEIRHDSTSDAGSGGSPTGTP
jgi:hypothetical protein